MKRIKVLGITGGVGAGKSTILSYLERKYQVRVIELDRVAHLLMEPGNICYQEIKAQFGQEILSEDLTIDRRKLGALTFSDPDKLAILNRIVHPQVKNYIREQVRLEGTSDRPFLVLEAALLLEDHYDEICDEIWYVYVDHETRKHRLLESRGYSAEKTEAILNNQKTEAEFRASCQFVIDNTSEIMENTYEQIDKGLTEHGFL